MSYLVIAPCVIAKDREGKLRHRYEGDVIAWLSDDQAEHFLGLGMIERTDKGVGGSDPEETEVGSEKPASTAKKEVLVAWIAENVAKDDGGDYTVDELNELTKAQLQEIIDSVED